MKDYKIFFIDGYTSKYTEFKTAAADMAGAKEILRSIYGKDFEHCILFVYEDQKLIFER